MFAVTDVTVVFDAERHAASPPSTDGEGCRVALDENENGADDQDRSGLAHAEKIHSTAKA